MLVLVCHPRSLCLDVKALLGLSDKGSRREEDDDGMAEEEKSLSTKVMLRRQNGECRCNVKCVGWLKKVN